MSDDDITLLRAPDVMSPAENNLTAIECFIDVATECAVRAWSTGDARTTALCALLVMGAERHSRSKTH